MSKILIIDDNELLGKMLSETLAEQGFDVKIALDANAGYSAAVEFHPDLMLVDVQLPDVVGFDLIRVMKNREELSRIPIIMITGTAHKIEDKVKGFQAGVDDYLLKPFETPELVERIKAVLRRTAASSTLSLPALDERESSSSEEFMPKEIGVSPPTLSLLSALGKFINEPSAFATEGMLPAVGLPGVAVSLVFVLGAMELAPGLAMKPAVAFVGVLSVWIALITALVISSSVAGIPCAWRDGSRIIALATLPMQFKLAGALIFACWTTLSPFYFTGGLPLVWSGAPFWAQRIDLFEWSSVYLLWILVRKRPAGTPARAWTVSGIVWLVGWALAAALGRLGTVS